MELEEHMTDFNDIDVSKSLAVPAASLFLRETRHLINNHSEAIDLVYWYRMESPLPRIRLDMVSEPALSNMLRDKMIQSAVPFIEQAIQQNVDYLEFIPGDEVRTFTVSDVERMELPDAEITILLSLSIPDIQTVSYKINDEVIRLPRLLCDSRTIKDVLEDKGLTKTWRLYHLVCSIDSAYLVISPFCPPGKI